MNKSELTPTDNLGEQTPALQLDTRSKILQAATEVFAESGYVGSSLRQITNVAGVNHGSIKYYYNNKDELWRACVKFLYSELEDAIYVPNEQWDGMSTREKIEHGMRSYIRFVAKNPGLFKIMMFETIHDSPRLDWLTENVTIPYTKKALDWIKKAKEQGIFPSTIPDMNMFYLMMSANRNIFFIAPEVARVFGKDIFSDEEIKRHEDAVVELFMGHLSVAED